MNTTETENRRPKLYLVCQLEPAVGVDRLLTSLDKVFAALPVSAVLIETSETPASTQRDALQSLVSHIQNHGAAAMIVDDVELCRSVAADGVHLPWRASITEDYETARAVGGNTVMIGADAGKSRHDAMTIGERGADYVAFGVPAHLKDQDTARARQFELVSWWAELFEIPVVAFDVHTADQARTAIAAGADFVAATMPPNSADQSAFAAWLEGYRAAFETTVTPKDETLSG